jgi:hypothetical protein
MGGRSHRANLLHSLSLMPSGTAFARDIVHRACMSLRVKIMSFLKEEHGGLLRKHWNLVLEKGSKETLLLVSRWTRALVGELESIFAVGWNFRHEVT